MITFKKFLTESINKKFVCLSFDAETNKKLKKYAESNGFNLGVDYSGNEIDPNSYKFHLTVYYTFNRVAAPDNIPNITPFEVEAKKLELLGKDRDVPVILIKKNDNLLKIREFFTAHGFKDVWPTWKPHVSLSYEKKNYNINSLKLPDFNLVVDKIEVQDQ